MKRFIAAASSAHVVLHSLRVSAIAGTLLNLVNHGGPWWQGQPPSWVPVLLNYLLAYLVASYSAARAVIGQPSWPSGGYHGATAPAQPAASLVPPQALDRLPDRINYFLRHADTAPEHLFSFAQFIADNEFHSNEPQFARAWQEAESFSVSALEEWDRAGRPAAWDDIWRARHRARAVALIAMLKAAATITPDQHRD